MNSFSQINREEAQALRRAKELERQAVLEASGGQMQEYANTGAQNPHQISRPPRMQVSQPQFRQPVPGVLINAMPQYKDPSENNCTLKYHFFV